jgi:hypothetical protein
MSQYFDAVERALAIKRLDQLKRLSEDLHGIVHGTLPLADAVAKAPLLHAYRFRCLPALCLGDVGDAAGSQVFMLDPGKRWVRTFSQFYRLGTADPKSWPRSGA